MALARDISGREIARRDSENPVVRMDDEEDKNIEVIMIYPYGDDEVVEVYMDVALDVDEEMDISCDGGCSYNLRLK